MPKPGGGGGGGPYTGIVSGGGGGAYTGIGYGGGGAYAGIGGGYGTGYCFTLVDEADTSGALTLTLTGMNIGVFATG